jgi:hypothetical protein
MTLRQLGKSPHQGLAKGSLLLQESRDRDFKSTPKISAAKHCKYAVFSKSPLIKPDSSDAA